MPSQNPLAWLIKLPHVHLNKRVKSIPLFPHVLWVLHCDSIAVSVDLSGCHRPVRKQNDIYLWQRLLFKCLKKVLLSSIKPPHCLHLFSFVTHTYKNNAGSAGGLNLVMKSFNS